MLPASDGDGWPKLKPLLAVVVVAAGAAAAGAPNGFGVVAVADPLPPKLKP